MKQQSIDPNCLNELDSLLDCFRCGAANRPKTESDLTLVIPTLGRAILETCLVHLVAGHAWPARIMVVDQGRREEIAEALRKIDAMGLPTEYVPSSKTGRAAGLNEGLAHVTTEFVMITDDDCIADANWVLNMAKRLRENPGRIVSGRVTSTGDQKVPMTVKSQQEKIQYRPGLKFDSLSGGNVGASMEVVTKVGRFDESLYVITAEDADWAYRALKIGIPIVYAPEVSVVHLGWRLEADRAKQLASYALSHGGFYGKHLQGGDWFLLARMIVHHFRALRRWLVGTIRRDDAQARIGRAYFTGLLPGIVTGWRGAKQLRELRHSPSSSENDRPKSR